MKLYRKLTAICLTAALAVGMAVTASADVSPVTVTVNGETASTSAYINSDWRTMVPAETAKALGVDYSVQGNSVTFTAGSISQTYTVGEAAGDTIPAMVNGTIYVPFYHLAEAFGYQVGWDRATGSASATGAAPVVSSARDLDSITTLDYDWSQAAQLPLTGWFTKRFEGGRQATVYIAEEASIRSYFTIVAVPDGVDTQKFLEDEGWIDLMDKKGEGLFVLEPGTNGWGSAEQEASYVSEAIGFVRSGNNSSRVNVFSTFGEFYVVGYGAGAAPLEAWVAANPIFVISQAYVGGQSAGQAALSSAGAAVYDGKNTSGYDPGFADNAAFLETLQMAGMKQIARKDVPGPTWLANYSGSQDYWTAANDCVSAADANGVYHQRKDSDAIQTAFANAQLPASAQYGIAQVKVTNSEPGAEDIYSFLSAYTRYDNTFAYSNALTYRLDYTSARVAAQQKAKDGSVKETLSNGTQILGTADTKIAGHGTVQVGVIAFSDNSGDGKWDPREYILYIPDGFAGKELPVLLIYPGNSQTDSIFMDSTLWWQIAEQKGVALAFVCETYSASPSSVSHADSDLFYHSLITILREKIDGKYADLDFTRVYGTGQSAGSMATQGFARTNPEFFAAVASTSGLSRPVEGEAMAEGVGGSIPDCVIVGQSDLANLLPNLWESETSQEWLSYLFEVNKMTNAELGSIDDDHEFVNQRTNVYTWENDDGIPVVKYGFTFLRAHNCSPYEMPILWDFLEHFSFEKSEDGTITRYYSASAFQSDDAVVIP